MQDIRFNRNSGMYFLSKLESEIKSNWSNKEKIKEVHESLSKYRSNNLKGFNYWAGFIGLAGTHTALIYSKKQVLHQMEKAAIPHLGICFGVGIVTGLLVGQMFGSSFKNYLAAGRVDRLATQRLSYLK